MASRIAIFGGSFDPVHLGHISLAETALLECGLERIIFMPVRISPFKIGNPISSGFDRYNMIKLAIAGNPAFELSSYELDKEGPSYTIETLRHCREELGEAPSFLIGLDSVVSIDKWRFGNEILRDYPVITVARSDTDLSKALDKIESFKRDYSADITLMHMEPVDISSTMIRQKAFKCEKLDGLVCPGVEEYIIEHNLYKHRGA